MLVAGLTFAVSATARATIQPIATHTTFDCAVRSRANGMFVSAELKDTGGLFGLLRARARVIGPWERFRCDALSSNLWALGSNGRYTSSELGYGGPFNGLLRARAGMIGTWEHYTFSVVNGCSCIAIKGPNSKFVSAELGYPGVVQNALRARASRVGPWEEFDIVQLTCDGSSCLQIADYSAPGSDAWGTAVDAQGRIWLALPGCDPSPTCAPTTPTGILAMFDPRTKTFSRVTLPAGYGQPLFVAIDANGAVWFTMPVTNRIGRYVPTTATFTQWSVPTANSGPWDLTFDHDGELWFTEHFVNKIALFDPSKHTFNEIATPATNSNPYGLAVDARDDIWFTENNDAIGKIAEYEENGTLNEYTIRAAPVSGLTPHLITLDSAGNVWWSEGFVGAIGTLNVADAMPRTNQGVREFFYASGCSCETHTSGVAIDSQGRVWFDDSLQGTFGYLTPSSGTFTIFGNEQHPGDGLRVDSAGRVWFNEEFVSRLAVASS